MTPCDKNDILDAINSQAEVLSECKPDVNMLHNPSTEFASGNCILTLGRERKKQ
jgi:hypothetical protein